MYRYILTIPCILVIITTYSCSKISDLRLCAEEKCETVLSHAKSLARVNNHDTTFLSFERGTVVKVLSKSAGNRPDLWGGEVDGRRGYFPRSFVREFHVLVPNPEKIVATEPHLSIEERLQGKQLPSQEPSKEEAPPGKTDEVKEEESDVKVEKDETEVDETEIPEDDGTVEQKIESQDGSEEKAELEAQTQTETAKQAESETHKDEEKQSETTKKDEEKQDTEKQSDTEKHSEHLKDSNNEPEKQSEPVKLSEPEKQGEGEKQDDSEIDETEVDDLDKEFEDQWEDETEMIEDENDEEDNKPIEQKTKEEDDKPTVPNTKEEDEKPTEQKTKEEGEKPTEQKTNIHLNDILHHGQEMKKDEENKDQQIKQEGKSEEIPKVPATSSENRNEIFEKETKDPASPDVEPDEHVKPAPDSKIDDLSSTPSLTEEKQLEVKMDEKSETESDILMQEKKPDGELPSQEKKPFHSPEETLSTEEKVNEQTSQVSSEKHDEKPDSTLDEQRKTDDQIPDEKLPVDVKPDEQQSEKQPEGKSDESLSTEADEKSSQVKSGGENLPKEQDPLPPLDEKSQEEQTKQTNVEAEWQMPSDDVHKIPQDIKLKEKVHDLQNEPPKEVGSEPKMEGDDKNTNDLSNGEKKLQESLLKNIDEKQVDVKPDEHPPHSFNQQPTEEMKPQEKSPEDSEKVLNQEQRLDDEKITKNAGAVPIEETKKEEEPLEEGTVQSTEGVLVKEMEEPKQDEKPVVDADVKDVKVDEEAVKVTKDLPPPKLNTGHDKQDDIHASTADTFTQNAAPQDATPKLEPAATQNINIHAEPTATQNIAAQGVMDGYTVVDGTPFPLEYFDDVEVEKSVVVQPSQSEIIPTPVTLDIQTDVKKMEDSGIASTLSSTRDEERPVQDSEPEKQPLLPSSDQLLSSMGVDQDVPKEKPVGQESQNMQLNQTQTDMNTPEEPLPGVPENQDNVYATLDFLSRKPLSHDHEVNMQKSADVVNEQKPKIMDTPKSEETVTGTPKSEETTTEQQQKTEDIPKSDETSTQEQQKVEDTQPLPSETVTSSSVEQEVPVPPIQETEKVIEEKDENNNLVGKDTTTVLYTDFDSPYNTDHMYGRKIDDDKLGEEENEEYKSQTFWVRALKNLENRLKIVVEKLPPSIQSLLEQEPLGMSPPMTVLVTLSACLTLLMLTCIGVLCGGNKKQKKKDPVVVVKGLEEQLFIMTKEKENLEDELQSVRSSIKEKEKELLLQISSSGNVSTELENYKVLNNELNHNIATMQAEIKGLRHEIDEKTRTAHSKQDQLTEITKQLKQKETKLHETEEKLKKSHKELNENREELKTYKTKANSFADQVEHLETRKKQLMDEADDWDEKVKDLTERLTQATSGQKQIQEDLAFKENELEVLRDCFLQLKAFENEQAEDSENVDGEDMQQKIKSMMDVSRINASLRTVEEEKNLLQHRVDIEVQARAEMEEQVASLERKSESLQMDKMKADRHSQDLQTKLNVLSNYFKEKELQLQKELGEQQALKKHNITKLESAGEQNKMIEEERDIYKMQVEDLKTEITSAEKDFRSQIAANEKKAHENWLAARSAERELKEARHDNTVLRQKLTDIERRLLGPSGLIRPLPTRGMPPQGIMNGPPPGMERPGSRPPPGPPLREDESFHGSPDRPGPPPGARVPPPHMDSRSPPLGPRMPPPHPHMDGRTPPPYDRRPPLDRRSPPMYDRGIRFPPPPHMDRRSPGFRMPPPDMLPSFRGPFPPRGPTSPPPPRNEFQDSNRFMGPGTPRFPPPSERNHTPRQQSQV